MSDKIIMVDTDQKRSDVLQGEITRPDVDHEILQDIVLKKYGLMVTSIQELSGYEDRNYCIGVDPQRHQPGLPREHGYVVKIRNSEDSLLPKVVARQYAAINCLLQHNIPTPEVIPNLTGSNYSLECLDKVASKKGFKNRNAVELRTYIPGKIISDVPYSISLLQEVGRFVASVATSFKSFDSPGFHGDDIRQWSLLKVPQLKQFTFCLQDERRPLIHASIDSFCEGVVKNYPYLPKGYIHGDLNETNILVDAKNIDGDYTISGVLDLGDSEYSYTVFDLAINIAYMMLDSDIVDPLDTPGHILAGYQSVRALTKTEWDVLVPCIAGRLAQSLTLGAFSHHLQPDHDYTLSSAEKTWAGFVRFCEESENNLLTRWRDVWENSKF